MVIIVIFYNANRQWFLFKVTIVRLINTHVLVQLMVKTYLINVDMIINYKINLNPDIGSVQPREYYHYIISTLITSFEWFEELKRLMEKIKYPESTDDVLFKHAISWGENLKLKRLKKVQTIKY